MPASSGMAVNVPTPANPRKTGSSENTIGLVLEALSGKVPPPQNHSEFTGTSPASARSALRGWLCRTTCASLSSVRQRRGMRPIRHVVERHPRPVHRPAWRMPGAGSRAAGAGTNASAAAHPAGSPASPNKGRKAGRNASTSCCVSDNAAPRRQQARAIDVGADVRRVGAQPCGGRRSSRPASATRVKAAGGQRFGSKLKWRSSCACSPGAADDLVRATQCSRQRRWQRDAGEPLRPSAAAGSARATVSPGNAPR